MTGSAAVVDNITTHGRVLGTLSYPHKRPNIDEFAQSLRLAVEGMKRRSSDSDVLLLSKLGTQKDN